jgi:hypothetical protein
VFYTVFYSSQWRARYSAQNFLVLTAVSLQTKDEGDDPQVNYCNDYLLSLEFCFNFSISSRLYVLVCIRVIKNLQKCHEGSQKTTHPPFYKMDQGIRRSLAVDKMIAG